ncbi:MAG: MFS transporter [Brevundimonas sp.]|nr:MAG: MFS transporter [Brevundimonas sp.]
MPRRSVVGLQEAQMATTDPNAKGLDASALASSEAQGLGVRWSRLQIGAVATCFILNMLDGMDILMMSYLAQSIATEWSVGAAALGVVFSAAIFGMMIGALALAPFADHLGRRPVILGAVALMGLSMIACGFATNVTTLIVLRFIVGLGIGAILASMAAITSEYSPARHRTIAVALLQAGYSIGAMLAGLAVYFLLPQSTWHWFMSGAGVATLLLLPLAYVLMPESLEFLEKRQPRNALARINRIRGKMGRPLLATLADVGERRSASAALLFKNGQWKQTLILWSAFFACYMTLYFVIAWVPKLAIEAGLNPDQAIFAGVTYNLGAFIGGLALCWLLFKFDVRPLVLIMMLVGAVALVGFSAPMTVTVTLAVAFGIGFAVQGGFNGLYPLVAAAYPAQIRSTGIGWCIGVGRAGAVLGPLLGGALLGADTGLFIVFIIFTVPLVVAGILATLVKQASQDSVVGVLE